MKDNDIVNAFIGKKVKFAKDNNLPYYQDFRFPVNIPSVRFTIDSWSNNSFILKAHGYGIISVEKGSYGNGAIHVESSLVIEQLIKNLE